MVSIAVAWYDMCQMQQLLDPIPSLLGICQMQQLHTRANAEAPRTKEQAMEWGPLCLSGTSSFPSKCKAGGYSCMTKTTTGARISETLCFGK